MWSKSRNTWTSTSSKASSVLTSRTTSVSSLSHLYRQLLLSVAHSHTFLVIERRFHAWFQLLSTKTHTSEWLVTLLQSCILPNLQAFIALSSPLFRERRLKCHQVIRTVALSLLTQLMTSRGKSASTLLVADSLLLSCKGKKVLTLISMFHSSTCNSFWRMTSNLKIFARSTAVAKWWQERLKQSWLMYSRSSLPISRPKENLLLTKTFRPSWQSERSKLIQRSLT